MSRNTRVQVQPTSKAESTVAQNGYWQRQTTFGPHAGLSSEAATLATQNVAAPRRANSPNSNGTAAVAHTTLTRPSNAHDLSRIWPHHAGTSPPWMLAQGEPFSERPDMKKKICTQSAYAQSSESQGAVVRAISAGGSGTVATNYTPEGTDKSTKIVFLQVMSESLDGALVKPSVAAPAFAYQDADTTGDFQHVDYVSGESDPYYNGDDGSDFGTQGNAVTKVAASTSDSPSYPDASFPPGKSKLLWDFRTAAFSAAGEDAGTYYGYSDWSYLKDKGIAGRTSTRATSTGGPGSKFESAVKLWNSNHGFKMPTKGGGILGGIIGGVLVGAAGVAIGGAIGGVAGAVVGGLVGLAAGAFVGSRKNDVSPGLSQAK
jgi:hypothetical protein